MNRGSIPNSRGEKNVRTLAALPTGGSAFCGALEEGMGDVFVSVTQTNKQTNKFSAQTRRGGGCRRRGTAGNIRRRNANICEGFKTAT